MIKISSLCVLLCFNLAAYCLLNREVSQPSDGSFLPPEEGDDEKQLHKQCSPNTDVIQHIAKLRFSTGSCYKTCDFESDLCNTMTNGMSPTGWIRRNGVNNVGSPRFDHNGSNTAHFLTLSSEMASYPAVLRSQVVFLDGNQLTCQISFYYWMGQINGTLIVGLQNRPDGTQAILWHEREGLKSQWQKAVITVHGTPNAEIFIQGQIFGPGIPGETIAIDDISVTKGCFLASDLTSLCKEKSCPYKSGGPNIQLCIPSSPATRRFCFQQISNFKIHLCDWNSDTSTEHVSWIPEKESHDFNVKSIYLKDRRDDTNGHNNWVHSDNSTLYKSLILNCSECYCFSQNCRFWFHYSLVESSVLKAVLYTTKGDEIVLWEASAPTNNEWVKAEIQIPAQLGEFKFSQLQLEGDGKSRTSTVCLDNFHCVGSEEPEVPMVSSPGEFACSSGYHLDCIDGSGECPAVCANSIVCDFESGLCEWKMLSNDDVQWNIMKGSASGDSGLPTKDHTINSDKGTFAYVTGSPETNTKPVSSLVSSPIFIKTSSGTAHCQLRFWYQLSRDSQLSVFIRDLVDGNLQSLHHQKPAESKMQWTKANIHIKNTTGKISGPFQIILQATVQSAKAFVAVDDIHIEMACETNKSLSSTSEEGEVKLKTSIPSSFNCPPGFWGCKDGNCISSEKFCDFTLDCPDGSDEAMCSATCDFETDSCGWLETANEDGFDWVRHSTSDLPPAFQKQAPLRDHTYNHSDGHFMFILRNRSSISQMAQLRSPKFSQAASGCTMTFWYYNYGLSVGAAQMQLLVDGVKEPTVLWRIYYNQGDQWLKAFIQLGRLPQPFQLSLDKVSLGFYDGVSAIDDITFENCALPPPVLSCKGPDSFWCRDSKACIDRLLLCDLVDDCGDGSDEDNCAPEFQCNFEVGLCNWEQDMDDDFNWTRKQGPTPTLNTGPMKDHTLGTVKGHYLYIESSEPQMFQNRAALLSPVFNSTFATGNKSCIFRFHYHMFGKQIYRLAVFQKTVRNTRGHLLWRTFGNQGNRWIRKVLHITSSEPFQILVEGTVGDGFTGDIGIDDLSFMNCILYNGNLPTDATTPSGTFMPVTLPLNNCTEEEFICRATGQCIDIIKRCDFRPDCSDNSDESSCVADICDFDDGTMCEWHQPATQDAAAIASAFAVNMFQWGLGTGASIHPGEENHRPLADHTTATKDGCYLYADSSNGKFGHIADIITPVISLTGPKCRLVFWNYMNGATVGSLKVLIKVGNLTSELWAQSGPQGPQWNRAEVFLGVRSYFQVLFRAKRGISYVGDVAVDDLSFEDCSPLLIPEEKCTSEEFTCANKYCLPKDNLCDFVNDCSDNSDESQSICGMSVGRCDFEFDLCDWQQDQNDDFDWSLRIGGIPRLGSGPIADHTLQGPSGHYIFIKSFFPQLPGQGARISSAVIDRRSKNCKIIFYYHMYGVKIGSLSVYQVTVSNSQKVLFNLSGDQGNFWKRKVLPLDAEEDFRITFEGRVGTAIRRYIALDDIVFTKECLPSSQFLPDGPAELPPTGSCSHGYLECLNGKCYRPEQSCDFEDDCGDNTDEKECGTSCNFENDMCGWQTSLADNFDWVMGTGSPQSLRPSKDHTLGNVKGHFLYLEATSIGVRGEKAHLKSSRWKESSTTCTLNFWYYMSSKATGHIQVFIKNESGFFKLWSSSGDRDSSGQWKRAEILLGKRRNFEVIFEGIRAKDLGGGAAIDDIEFKNCSTIGEDSGMCPSVTDFVCWNKKCIESHLVCDYKADCDDRSDEADCSQYLTIPGSCNFETPGQNWTAECGLTQDYNDEFDWQMSTKAVIKHGGPDKDHTPGNGHNFLYVNSSTQRKQDKARILTTSYFPASLGICRLRFWFWTCNSSQIGVLKVYTVEEYGMDILMWSATGNRRSTWMYANVLLSRNSPFRVAFEAEVGAKEVIEFALDDVSFTPECLSGGPVVPHPPTCTTEQFTCAYVKQCVPLAAKCDRVEDCADGTDEMNCPTEEPPAETPGLCKETEFPCANRSCIPSLLRCDGVADCRFREDEADCPIKDCFNGSLLCPSTNTCIPVSRRCDGIVDCIDFSLDESSCSDCPEAYCKNGGTCNKDAVPVCQCENEWTGNRCHIKANPSLASSPGSLQTDTWIGLGIGFAFLLIEIAVAVSCILSKRRQPRTKTVEPVSIAFDNPLYEAQTVKSTECAASLGVQISVSPWQAQQEFSCTDGIKTGSFANPLYGRTTENMENTIGDHRKLA